jgi:hypothetical protein
MFGDPHHGSAGIGQPWLAVSGWLGTGRAGLWSASAVFAPGSALNTKLSAPAVLQAWLASCVGACVPLSLGPRQTSVAALRGLACLWIVWQRPLTSRVQRYPIPPTGPLISQLKFGRAAAPCLPQTEFSKRGLTSDTSRHLASDRPSGPSSGCNGSPGYRPGSRAHRCRASRQGDLHG